MTRSTEHSRVEAPDGVELWPSSRRYARFVLPLLPVALLVAGLRVWAQSRSPVVAGAVAGGELLLIAVVIALVLRGSWLRAGARALHQHRPIGRSKRVERADIATVLVVPRYRPFRSPEAPLLAVLDRAGRALVRVQGPMWDAGEVERFVAAAQLGPVERIDAPTTWRELRGTHAAALGYADRHPGRLYLWSVLGGVVLVGVVLGVAALTVGLGG